MNKTYKNLISEVLPQIREIFPWDLADLCETQEIVIVDIREPEEVAQGSIQGALHVPRGILEAACDWGYSETIPHLVAARDKPVVLACRSGNRSALAAFTLQLMGYQHVYSLKTGIRGWNDAELPLVTPRGDRVNVDEAEHLLSPPVKPEQLAPR